MAVLKVPSNEYPTIQSAVEAATRGDRIKVKAGTFVESIVIGPGKDGLRITGKGAKTVVDGGGHLETGFTIQGSEAVTIEDLVVQNFTRSGIKMETSSNIIREAMVTGMGSAGIVTGAGTSGNLILGGRVAGNAGAGIVVNELKGNNLDIKAQPPADTANILAGNAGS